MCFTLSDAKFMFIFCIFDVDLSMAICGMMRSVDNRCDKKCCGDEPLLLLYYVAKLQILTPLYCRVFVSGYIQG